MSSAPLRLISYTTSASLTESSLAALPAATLTKLKLLKLTSSRWSLSLEKLSNLRSMHVCLRGVGTDAATSFLQGVGRLPQLTQLRIINPPPGSDMRVLPASLQHLQLSNRVDAETGAPLNAVFVDLQRLTCLKQLQLRSRRITPSPSVPIAEGSSVPANLLSLATVARWPEQGLVGLASLHQVTLIQLWGLQDSCRANHLMSMCHLTQLKQLLLDLRYDQINEGPPHNGLLEVAAVWHKTPLSCLQIEAASSTATALQQLMQHVAAVTRLTKLVLTVRYVSALFAPAGLAICEQLTALRGLESLELSVDRPDMFAQQDAQHLSTLVALSGLHLKYAAAGPHIAATTICLLALSLTRLQTLSIHERLEASSTLHFVDSGGLSNYALPVIGRLKSLEHLRLGTFETKDAERGLQLLTGLSKLSVLKSFYNVGPEARDAFWAMVPARLGY